MDKQKFLITTAIDYCNDVIHVGHAYEKLLADALARYYRLTHEAKNVYFLTGTDEHGTTNEKAAQKRGISTEEHVTEISQKDQAQIDSLNVSYDRFIRTTDSDHVQIAADFYQKAVDNGDIYKGTYEGLYCESCESYKTLTELDENGQCPLHPTKEIQKYEEENYFFAWSKYQDFLLDLIESNKIQVLPDGKRSEMLAFLREGLQDIPVTRPKYKLPWGITAPNDEDHVLYVWFDALINYFTAGSQNNLWNDETFIIHFVGKDIARWHVLLWPAMLQSAGYQLPDTVYVHGFMNLNGQKISKSRGNVIAPSELVDKYGADAVRYYLLKHGPIVEDVDISIPQFEEVYTADLANGLGNLVARTAKVLEKAGYQTKPADYSQYPQTPEMESRWSEYRADQVAILIWEKIRDLDKYIDETKPWELLKSNEVLSAENSNVWEKLTVEIREIAQLVEPFIPDAAAKIKAQFAGTSIASTEGLFPRLTS
ncbi:methionine--tRNA ligase [candidate division WWE3 bacterium]|uniref:methionine--tRNA ligase n=1 Tax=candidate division WWE3 bacterium TaxID=2053526 RepID=A0A955LGQ8_UNCKA|nr:methionine--tRNA ligase [candidate division WWE3 bacterium]